MEYMKIFKLRADPVIDFAAEELKKYLRMMMPERGDIAISLDPGAENGFRLGLLEDFGLPNEAPDPKLDDVVHVDTGADGGVLAGSNPRSVLFSVYRFLRLNGCRFLFPGPDGEFIPHAPLTPQKYHHMADCRYRGHTTEGDPSYEQVLDYIDLHAKQELNVYGLLGIHTYHRRYYLHDTIEANRTPEPVSADLSEQWKGRFESELLKRGIMLWDGAHDLLPMSIGLDPADRYDYREGRKELPEEAREYLAMLDGKRDLFRKDIFCTNMCMSRADWRAKYVKLLADFAQNNPQIVTIGVFLSDGNHNHCTCPLCRDKRPSDQLVVVLNDLDEELTRRGISTVFRFSTYVDAMFPPVKEKIKNPGRFLLDFAPISRTYTSSITEDTVYPAMQDYSRNVWLPPKSIEACSSYLRGWQEQFGGEGYIYEYHFWWAQYRDPGLADMSRRIWLDMRALKPMGLSGDLEDGSNKSYFPHGFHCHIYAETLVDRDCDYEAEEADYFSHLYGEDWQQVRDYLRGISKAFGEKYMAGEDSADHTPSPTRDPKKSQMMSGAMVNRPHYNPARVEPLSGVVELTARARELALTHLAMPTRPQTVAWRLLLRHTEYCRGLAAVLIEKCQGHDRYALEKYQQFIDDFGKYDLEMDRYFDFPLAARANRMLVKHMPAIEF